MSKRGRKPKRPIGSMGTKIVIRFQLMEEGNVLKGENITIYQSAIPSDFEEFVDDVYQYLKEKLEGGTRG